MGQSCTVLGAIFLFIGMFAAPLRAPFWPTLVNALGNTNSDFYDRNSSWKDALAPALWLVIVWVCSLTMLYAAGYLSADREIGALDKYVAVIGAKDPAIAARRAAYGLSGVTLAVTLALALTSFFWCAAAAWNKAGAFRITVLFWSTAFLVFALTVSTWANENWEPFTTRLGQKLLQRGAADSQSPWAQHIPLLMFVLSSVVPSLLLAGTTLLLQPMWKLSVISILKGQLAILKLRLRELDQMLYIGAIALVFGTLQLSSGLSVPLVSMPNAADVKAQADLCKTIGPSTAASSVFFPSSAPTPSPKPKTKGHPKLKTAQPTASDLQCAEVPNQFAKLDAADGLRQLVRGITLCFGLSFSALLAAIYVPGLIVLRKMIEERQDLLAPLEEAAGVPLPERHQGLVVEPFSRIGAVVATLSPLLAGLVANALAGR